MIKLIVSQHEQCKGKLTASYPPSYMPKILNIGVCKNSISNVDVSKKTTAVYQASANYPFHQKRGWRKSSPFYLGRTNQTTNQIWGSSTFPALPPDSIHYMILDTSIYIHVYMYVCPTKSIYTNVSV